MQYFTKSYEIQLVKLVQEFFAMSIICTTQVWLLKAAFLGYYWSLRETLSDKVKILLYAVSAYTILTYIGVLTLQFTYCRPLPRNWYCLIFNWDYLLYTRPAS